MGSSSNPNTPTPTLLTGTTETTVTSMNVNLPRHNLRNRLRPPVHGLLAFVLVAIAPFAVGQHNAANVAPPALRISAGDLLAVDVFDTPELSAKLRVSETGDIDLPVAGSTHVGGLAAEEAAASIEQVLRDNDILKHPHVEVFIQEYATQGVSVLGAVNNPGVYTNLGSP